MTRSNLLPALFAAFAAVALAAPADAARVKQVRVGDHAAYTRIVVELDGPAGYSVDQKAVAGVAELVVGLEATTTARIITSNSRLVEHVALRPGTGGAEAHIQLRSGAVHVKEMVLKSPHRIVLDISPAPSTAAASSGSAAKPATASAAKPATASTAKPATASTATTAKTASAPKPAPKAAPSQTKLAAAPKAEPADATRAADASPSPGAMERQRASEARGSEAPTQAESEPGEAQSARGERPSASESAAKARAAATAAASGGAAREASEPTRAKKKKAEAPTTEPTLVERLGGGDTGVGLSVVLGGVALLLAAFLLLRRRSRRAASEAAAAPWPPPGAEDSGYVVGAESSEEEPAQTEGNAMTGAEAPLFAATERDGDDDEEEDPVVELPQAVIDAEPEVVAKADSPEIEELERRIERLEARLTDSLDARERLERQLAAHTEELRVQRAAIARTQRAVRAAVRGPEAGEQPAAQRVPSPQASTPESGGSEG